MSASGEPTGRTTPKIPALPSGLPCLTVRLVLLVLLALGGAVRPSAQPTPPPPLPVPPRPLGEVTVTTAAEPPSLDLARRLLRAGQTDEAIARLEDLRDNRPDATAVDLLLREAYATAGRWDDALRLLDESDAAHGATVGSRTERGVLLHRAGRADDAARAFDAAVEVAPTREATYRTVGTALADLRLHDAAEALYARGAEALGDPGRFDMERAALLGAAGRYEDAAARYLDVLVRETVQIGAVRDGLTVLLDADATQAGPAAEAFARAADAALARHPTNRAIRHLVGWIAMERGDHVRALDAARALDRLEAQAGRGLLDFAASASAAGAHDAALTALGEVISRYPGTREEAEARAVRATLAAARALDAGERASRGATPLTDAADADFAALDAAVGLPPEAWLAWADLRRNVRGDLDGARERYARVTGALAPRARLALADVDVRAGDLDAAREHYAALEAGERLGDVAEQSRFELARLDFYEGLVYSALARAEAMDENTASDLSNDAISLRVTLQENITEVGVDTVSAALRAFAAVSLRHRQTHDERALASLDSLLAAAPGHPITDDALFLRAQILTALGRAAEAVETLDRLAQADPTSFFRDRALMLQGSALERALGDPSAAAGRYEQLLTLFPASLFAPEARAHLRRLRAPS